MPNAEQLELLPGVAQDAEEQSYQAFVDKFKTKKTTDDCYTPKIVYDAVADWVASEYGIPRGRFLRPFFPGGDYEHADYPDGFAVVDNPPFSILGKIVDFYLERGVPFFLFVPALTCMGYLRNRMGKLCILLTGCKIVYENGANINTAFITNMECRYCLRTAPDLRAVVSAAADAYAKSLTATLPKYTYPPYVVTGGAYLLSKYGQDFRVCPEDAVFVSALDSQRETNKAVYGGGLLISEHAAAERVKAERAAVVAAQQERAGEEHFVWELSDREYDIIQSIGDHAPAGSLTGIERKRDPQITFEELLAEAD